MPDPQQPCPKSSTFFTTNMVKKSIDKMKTSRAYDHDGLVVEHFIHATDMLVVPLAVLLNKAMCEGFPSKWSKSIIIPILKSGDPMEPRNYCTIMIGHTLARLFASILEQELSEWAERGGIRATGQAGFRKGFSTLDHILTLRAVIEEGRSHGKTIYCCFVDFHKAFDTILQERLFR